MKDINKEELDQIQRAVHNINNGEALKVFVDDRIKVYKIPSPQNLSTYTIRVDIKVTI